MQLPTWIEGRERWVGAALGVLLASIDTTLSVLLGFDIRLGGVDATLVVLGFLIVSFGGLGWLVGYLFELRRKEWRARQALVEKTRALEAARRSLHEREKLAALGQVAASISHEIRNPLAILRSSIQDLAEALGRDAAGREQCEELLGEIDRLTHVSSAILGFSRPLRPDLRAVAPGEVLRRVELLSPPELAERSVRLEVVDGTNGGSVRADVDLLAQALLALVSNACRAVGSGGTVWLRSAGLGSEVLFEVVDDGPGVAEEDRERIFEAFFTRHEDGHGLGLSIAQQIAAAHDSRIELLDSAGAGAHFRLRLPGVIA